MGYNETKVISQEIDNNLIYGSILFSSQINNKVPLIVLNSGYGPSGSKSSTWKSFISKMEPISNQYAILKWDYVGQGLSEGDMLSLTPLQALKEMNLILKRAKYLDFIDENRIFIY